MHRIIVVLALCGVASAAIFPEKMGEFVRSTVKPVAAPDAQLYKELGFAEAEQAEYITPGGGAHFKITGWKVADSTAAFALYEARRPADAKPSKITTLAAETSDGIITAYGNFIFEYSGRKPTTQELDTLLITLKPVERSPLPALRTFLPEEELIPNSERYILGPVTLARYAPWISPSLAAFHLAAEAQQGRYKTGSGEITLTLFSYPAPNMARDRQAAFLQTPGVVAKRSGSLVAVIYPPTQPVAGFADDAERVLGRVRYELALTNQEVGKGAIQGMANIVLTGFLLAGVIMAASLLAGIWLGGFRVLLRKFGWAKEKPALTVLRIGKLGDPPQK